MDIHKECRISQYMFHIQKITGPLSLDQLEQFKDLSEIQAVKISAADTDRLAQEIRTGNWNNNKVKQTVSYNTWVTPCIQNTSHETEAEKLLKASHILRELLPKYICPNHTAEDLQGTTDPQATKTNGGNLNTVDVTKLKQLMRRAVEKLPDSSIVDVEEFMMLCLEEFDAESQQEKDEKQAWNSHRKIPTENETYDENFERKMTSVITATLNACSRRLRKIERTQVVIKPKTKTNEPCVSYKEAVDVSNRFAEHHEVLKEPTMYKNNSEPIEHNHQDKREHNKTQQLEKLYRRYKKREPSESSYPSRFSYYLPEGAEPNNWTVNAQPDDYTDDHYYRESVVVPRLDLGFTVQDEKPDLSHHSTYSSYWSKSLSSEGSFREWLNKQGVKNYKAEKNLHNVDEKNLEPFNNTYRKLTSDELKAMEPSTTESCEGTFSLGRSFVSLMDKQKNRTERWVDKTFSDTKLMREYGSDIFDSSDQSEHSAASTCTTDWTSLTNRKSNRSETNPLVAENPRRDVTKVEHTCHQNVEPVYINQPLSQADKDFFARELSDIQEESSYPIAAQEAYSWSDISVLSRDGDYVQRPVSTRSIPDEGYINGTLSDISVFSRSRDGYTPSWSASEHSMDGKIIDVQVEKHAQGESYDQEFWTPQNNVDDATPAKLGCYSEIPTANQRKVIDQEEHAEILTLVNMHGHNYTRQSGEWNDHVTDPDYANEMVTKEAELNVPMYSDLDAQSDISWEEELHLDLGLDSPVQSGGNQYQVCKNRTSEVDYRNMESQLNPQTNNGSHVGFETMSRDSHVSLASIKVVAGEEDVDALSVQSSYGSWHRDGQEEFDESTENFRKSAYRRGEYNIIPEDLPKQFFPGLHELPQIQAEINSKFESRYTKRQSPSSPPAMEMDDQHEPQELEMKSLSQVSVTPVARTPPNFESKNTKRQVSLSPTAMEMEDRHKPQKLEIKCQPHISVTSSKRDKEERNPSQSEQNNTPATKISPKTRINFDKVNKEEPMEYQVQNQAADDLCFERKSSKIHDLKPIEQEPSDEVLEIISLTSQLSDKSAAKVTSNTSQGSHNSASENIGLFQKVPRKELPSNIAINTSSQSSLAGDDNEIPEMSRSSHDHSMEAMKIESFTSNTSNGTAKTKSEENIAEKSNHQNDVKGMVFTERIDATKSAKTCASNTSQGLHNSTLEDVGLFKKVQRKEYQSNTAMQSQSRISRPGYANEIPEVSRSSHDHSVEVMKIESFTSNSSTDTAKTTSEGKIVQKANTQTDIKRQIFTNTASDSMMSRPFLKTAGHDSATIETVKKDEDKIDLNDVKSDVDVDDGGNESPWDSDEEEDNNEMESPWDTDEEVDENHQKDVSFEEHMKEAESRQPSEEKLNGGNESKTDISKSVEEDGDENADDSSWDSEDDENENVVNAESESKNYEVYQNKTILVTKELTKEDKCKTFPQTGNTGNIDPPRSSDHDDDDAKSDNSSGWDSSEDSNSNRDGMAVEDSELDKNVPEKVDSHGSVERKSLKDDRSDLSIGKEELKPMCYNTDTKDQHNNTSEVLYNGALVIKDGGCDDTSDECSVIDMPPDEKKKWMERRATQHNEEEYRALNVDFLNLNDIIDANIPSGGDRELAKGKFLAAIAGTSYVESIEPEHQTTIKSARSKPAVPETEVTNAQVHAEPVLAPLQKKDLSHIQPPTLNLHLDDPLAHKPLSKPQKLEPLPPLKNVSGNPLQRQGTLKPLASLNLTTQTKKVKSPKKENKKCKKKGKEKLVNEKPKQKEVVPGPKNSSSTETFSAPSCDEVELGEMLRMDDRKDDKKKLNMIAKMNMPRSAGFNNVIKSMEDEFAQDDYGDQCKYRSTTRTAGRMEDDFIENSYDSSDSDVPKRNVNYNSRKNNDTKVTISQEGRIQQRSKSLVRETMLVPGKGGESSFKNPTEKVECIHTSRKDDMPKGASCTPRNCGSSFDPSIEKAEGSLTSRKDAMPKGASWTPEFRTWDSLNLVSNGKYHFFQSMPDPLGDQMDKQTKFTATCSTSLHGYQRNKLESSVRENQSLRPFHERNATHYESGCTGSLGSLRIVQRNGCPKIELLY